MKNICIILAFLLQVALGGCSNVELTQKDFVGIWKSPEGALINLNSDGTCTTKDMKLSKFHYNGNDFIGKWDLKTTGTGLNCNYSLTISCDSVFFYEEFQVSGSGLFGNTYPWYFFQFEGDPDDWIKYKFEKIDYITEEPIK